MPVYHVSVLQTHRDYFDYIGPDHVAIGARVWVPFRQAKKLGVVVGIDTTRTDEVGLKTITEVLDKEALLSPELLKLCRWVNQYYQSPLALVLNLVLPKRCRQGQPATILSETYYELALPVEKAQQKISVRAVKQQQCLTYLATQGEANKASITQSGYSSAIIQALLDQALIKQFTRPIRPQMSEETNQPPVPLNSEQQQAYSAIAAKLDCYHCFLLQGVTGSGKTEVYFQVIADVLAQGRQVLILVPEIGLTPQLRQRFQARFSEPIGVMHSKMSDSERQQTWLWARDQQLRLVLGTRSALFTPLPKLGLIIIDEEHDTSLKQMEGVRYLARDTALIRAHHANIPVILGSATPSLESLANVAKGKYSMLRLNQKALNVFPLRYQIVDLRSQHLLHGLASATYAAIERHLSAQHQVLIFINRRGFSPVLLCHLCGWKAACPHCDACLTVHRAANQLICHHCGYHQISAVVCPSCQGRELIFMGSGTQRIEESLATVFPKTKILRIDRDVTQKKQAFDQHLAQIHAGEAQLIVGTQMLAKGHDFSRLSLVVVLDADYGFYDQDFRALERLGQLITQVSGRAGRADIPGEVVIQTHVPDHPLLNTLIQEGYDPFAQALLQLRQEAHLPPCSFMALLRVQGKQQDKLLQLLHAVKQRLTQTEIIAMGPAPAPLAKKGGHYRMQLLLKSASRHYLQAQLTPLRAWMQSNGLVSGLRWNLDVDPIDLA
ncbi:MAG: primosomal protein N' [Gammaproteobacteria bacterium]|nr:primosomal protein N' [Gammaproteobacteria bacterium]